VTMRLRVEPRGESSFETSLDKLISWLAVPSVGEQLQVKYDPDNTKHIVILEDSNAAPVMSSTSYSSASSYSSPAKTIDQELSNLARLHQNGDLSDAEFEKAKKKLLE